MLSDHKQDYAHFRRWSHAGVCKLRFKEFSPPNCEYMIIDATISKVHIDATSKREELKAHAIGRSHANMRVSAELHIRDIESVVRLLGLSLDLTVDQSVPG